jgi:formimidoylglutamate deiminase
MKVLEADLTLFRGKLEPALQVEIAGDGAIGRVGPGLSPSPERLRGEALLPGFVNAHSHAFQRGLRGKAESYGEERSTFWSWREEMYRLVGTLDPERMKRLTALAFEEMLRSGITAVGEFHYVHHVEGSLGYELDDAVVEAARETGIRLVLLDVCYQTGDVGKPLEGAQTRFRSPTVEEFLKSAERLESRLERGRESLGLVAHSIRAVPIEGVAEIHERARTRGLVFHMHVEEQQREIAACVARYGKSPLALLLDRLEAGPELTAVHCTHSTSEDLERLLASGANVCVCPLTEANLADGLLPIALADPEASIALGTDSNLRIDFTEEMRLLEYERRLADERRGIFRDRSGSVGPRLFQIATEGGARSLGLRAGRIETGYAADFFTLDLGSFALAGATPDELLTAFALGAGPGEIARVFVAGDAVVPP